MEPLVDRYADRSTRPPTACSHRTHHGFHDALRRSRGPGRPARRVEAVGEDDAVPSSPREEAYGRRVGLISDVGAETAAYV